MILAAQIYRPPFPERPYWKQDLDDMKAAGLNAVQLGCSGVGSSRNRAGTCSTTMTSWWRRRASEGWAWCSAPSASSSRCDSPSSQTATWSITWATRSTPQHRGKATRASRRAAAPTTPEVLRRHWADVPRTRWPALPNSDNMLGWDIWNELRWNVQAMGWSASAQHHLRVPGGLAEGKYGDLDGLNAGMEAPLLLLGGRAARQAAAAALHRDDGIRGVLAVARGAAHALASDIIR